MSNSSKLIFGSILTLSAMLFYLHFEDNNSFTSSVPLLDFTSIAKDSVQPGDVNSDVVSRGGLENANDLSDKDAVDLLSDRENLDNAVFDIEDNSAVSDKDELDKATNYARDTKQPIT